MATATVTVVFTDLVGSTAMMSRVGEVAADRLRREHFDLLREPVGTHDGVEVKNLGDGLMVVFTSAADAVAAAVAMQQALWRRNQRADETLEIRVGIAAGDAEVDDGDYFGAPVVQAARLCSAAGTGEVLCTELVRMLAGSRAEVAFESVGALELKGLDDPVPTARVRWPIPDDGPADGTHALPGRLAMAVARDFVGREEEFERLRAAWRAADGGNRQVVLLAGEPGIGKTTLAARLASEAYDAGALVAYGRSDEDLGIPYQPWIETLTHLVSSMSRDVLDAHVADRGGHLGRLVPELTRRTGEGAPDGGDGDAERFVLFGCVVDLLERASADRPVLVVLDDLHWADRQSVQLLRHVVGCGRPLRVLFLGTFRDSDVATGHPVSDLLAGLHREQGTDRILLRGLSDTDVLGLLEQLAGHDMDDRGVDLRDAVLAETAGNPFFVREILRHLVDSGVIYQGDDRRWVGEVDVREVGLPVSVTEVVGRRLATLGDDSVRLLSIGAVIGRDFDVPLLARAAGVDEDTVVDTCDAAESAAILTPAGDLDRYSFAHALIERTLYEGLSRSRRARAHRSVAEALEHLAGDDPGPRAAELAHHWSEAVQPDDDQRAVRYSRLAADRALAQLAPDDAARWYSQALGLLDAGATGGDRRQHIELLIGLGIAQRQTGEPAYRETLLTATHLADESDEVDLLVRAALANSRGFFSRAGHVDGERISVVDRALERVDGTETAERARLLALAAAERMYLSPLAERVALAEEAVSSARATGDPATCVSTIGLCVWTVTHPSTLALRTAWLGEACEALDRLDDPVLAFWIQEWSMVAALERADGDALDAHADLAEEMAERVPDATVRWNSTMYRAWLAGVRGQLTDYEALADAALNEGLESAQPDAMTLYGGQLLTARYYQGRVHEMVPVIEQGMEENPGLPVWRAALALAKARAGDREGVRTLLTGEASRGFYFPDEPAWSISFGCWAEAAATSGAVDVAPALRTILSPYRKQLAANGNGFLASVAHHLGLLDHVLGEHDAAEQSFAEALDLHERVSSPILVAQTQAAWAALLADRGRDDDCDRARDMAQAALDTATAGGYGYIEADTHAVLDRLA